MSQLTETIQLHLQPLVGLRLTIVRRAAGMRIFHFGPVVFTQEGSYGWYALHVQCPWRIEGPSGIVTARSDLWCPAIDNEDVDSNTWDYEQGENLQDWAIRNWLGDVGGPNGDSLNKTNILIVDSIHADDYGGVVLYLSGGYRLVLFPAGSRGEDWRIFKVDSEDAHFVISGGRVEERNPD